MKRPAIVAFAFAAAIPMVVPVALRAAEPTDARAIARTFATSGDIDAALGALERSKTSPTELLARLREVPSIETPTAGRHTIRITDNGGRTTDLLIVAPVASAIAARSSKGLGLAVLLHGLGGSSRQATAMAEKLAATGEVVAIAPSAQPVPASELTESDGIAPNFKQRHWWAYDDPRCFVLEAIRVARTLYPIDDDRVVLSGMSMGGFGTWNIGLRHPDMFAGLVPLAGCISYTGLDEKAARALIANGRGIPLLSVHGNRDTVVPYGPDREGVDALRALGAPAELRTMEGVGHDLRNVHQGVGEIAGEILAFLTSKRRSPSPDKVSYTAVDKRLDGTYWLRIVERDEQAKLVEIEGRIDRAKNAIHISASGATKVRVFLDDRLLDLSKPVSIVVGQDRIFHDVIAPNHRAILESWRSRQDKGLVYPAFVDVDPRPLD